jgi:hypothetical protein
MIRLIAILATSIALSGCTLSEVYTDGSVVAIDGQAFMVRPLKKPANMWQAAPDDNSFGAALDLAARQMSGSSVTRDRSVRAIEVASGCTVDPASIWAVNNTVTASAICE